ncbi:hypothetical protein BLJ79_21435 [Arthrobacter sp. UCD-GKA]|uniref:DNA N-6-adenine-methyltransferase n=1 Tax=Arthrobacter sp. UCD-GKA TaxID=1913576 RepID=UPI0008DD8BA3|nr:DNA N-6-adenine-methyltransferase [Arthrobacter sp. UCD-GKA]OIH81926.1 hypothetical protein BLJ79_21435 [Arthrobacter sp. UCD-GKA]
MTTELIEKKSNGWLGGENQNMGGAQRETRWLTPPSLIAPLGPFDLDPCGAPGQELATRTYLLENGDDGLRDPWEGRVWLNPPYGKQADPFMAKMAAHGRGTALVFARTETRTWHNHIWPNASAILFLAGRVTFLDAEGVAAKANSGAPSVLIAYGAADAEALECAGIAGKFVRLQP